MYDSRGDLADKNFLGANSRQAIMATGEAAAFLGASPKTLAGWRRRGYGPAFIRQGRSIRYRLADLIAFQERHRVEPERA